jgi:hypothetical protein
MNVAGRKCGVRRTQRGVRWISKAMRAQLLHECRIADQAPASKEKIARKKVTPQR